MRFFVDNNLSPKLARGMAAFGEDVTHLQDHYPVDAKDTDWLPRIGRDEWILLTRDEHHPSFHAAILSRTRTSIHRYRTRRGRKG